MSLKKEVTTPTSPLFPNYLWLTSILRLTCLVLSGVWLIFGKCTNSGFIVPDLYFFGTGSVGSSNITGNGWNVFANHCQQWQDLRPVWTEVVLRSWRCKYGMTGYLWFIGLSMVFCYQCYISNMISTVCIYIYCCIHTDSSRVLQLRSGSTTTPCHQLGECGLGGSGFVSQLSIFWCKNYPHVMMTWKKRYHIRSTWGK